MATTTNTDFTVDELRLAGRNHALPLEALRYEVTPVGLHYVLVHYDIPALDPAAWRLHVDGAVDRAVSFSLDDLRGRPARTLDVTLECAGTGRAHLLPRARSQPWLDGAVSTATWTGTPLAPLLEEVGLADDVVELVFTGHDRGVEGGIDQYYQRSLTVAAATDPDVMLAYELNGAPLPPQHGFPVRLLVPGWYGMTHVKWLDRISAVTEPFEGYQQARAYRFTTAEGESGRPLDRIAVRSLITPPGVPEFMTRRRFVAAGSVAVSGRAWSGSGEISSVEFSSDGGSTWTVAVVEPPKNRHAWQAWHTTWKAEPGEHVLLCRATDTSGARQPDLPAWNVGGYAVNHPHRLPVTVTEDGRPDRTD